MTTEPQTSPTNPQEDLSASSSAPSASPRFNSFSPRFIFLAWLASLPLLLLFIGRPEVSRTQEARVLEVARQMLGHPLIDYLIPKINGDVRLQKPPLTYWLTALAYHLFGISESTGRIPTAIMGWLTLAVTYCAAKWLFNSRAGLLSAASLLGSYYFARHTRLAETDIPATLFVTMAIYAFWRASIPARNYFQSPITQLAIQQDPPSLPAQQATSNYQPATLWLHLAALATGLAVLSKGAPALFALIFFIAYALLNRRRELLKRFITSGAILTFFIIALPWFLFAIFSQGWSTFLFEIRNVEAGTDHGAPMYQYIPWIIVGTLPFAPIFILAIATALPKWRDEKIQGLLLWLASIAVPLCITANKQNHYLIPLLPNFMIFTGWLIDRWNYRPLIIATFVSAIVLPPTVTWLLPNLVPQHARENAAFVRNHFDDSPLCFYGPNASIPLCFNLKRVIPFANDPPELKQFLQTQPNYVIITITKDLRPASAPEGESFESLTEPQKWEDQIWQFYKLKQPPPP